MIFNVGWTELIIIFVAIPLAVGLLVLTRYWLLAYWGISERITLQRQSNENQLKIIGLLEEISSRLPESGQPKGDVSVYPRNPITRQ